MTSNSSDSVISSDATKQSSMANHDRKALHDLLLADMPEGVVHESCSLCLSPTEDRMPEGGTRVSNTYTEDELQSAVSDAVASATAEMAARIKSMEEATQESEIAAAVAAAKAELASEVEELRSKLDDAVLAAQVANSELDTFRAGLEELAAAETAAAEAAARKEERLAKVKEVADFPDEYLSANADRFAAMSEEDFESRLADWAVVAPAKSGDRIPTHTALTAAREDTNSSSGMGVIREAMRANLVGTDLRTL